MTLPASGAISVSQMATEFGVSLPCVFPDAFYGKAGLPASGTLAFSNFYGKSAAWAVDVSPPSVFGSSSTNPVTASATAYPTGGVGPYTYVWFQLFGDAGIEILTPNAASTIFRTTGLSFGAERSGTFACQITDANHITVQSADTEVSLARN